MIEPCGWRGALCCAAATILAAAPCRGGAQTAPPASPSAITSTQPAPTAGQLDPQSPLAPLPGLGVAWPDLSAAPPEPADPNASAAVAGDVRYDYRIDGIDGVATPLLRERFKELSALATHDGSPANAAQLDRRAKEDTALLVSLLKAEGYYDARVTSRLEPRQGRPLIVLEADPGVVYKLDRVTLAGLPAAGDKAAVLNQAFAV
ncbi:MAG: outer membrane protein assembly factor, partial [Sphingomonas sp.]